MNTVIACIDGSAISESVCDAAVWASGRLDVPLLLLHALEKTTPKGSDNLSGAIGLGSREHLLDELTELDEKRAKLALEHGRQILDTFKQRAEQEGIADIVTRQYHGNVLESLVELSTDVRLIVLGRVGESHERSAQSIGNHVENTVRAMQRPILITVGEFKAPGNFMIAYDGRETADLAIARISASPLLKGLPCHLIMTGEDNPERRGKLEAAQAMLEGQGFSVHSEIIAGDIYPTLKQYVETHQIELLAMGAFAHSKVRQFFVGSNTAKMISSSNIPLLIIK